MGSDLEAGFAKLMGEDFEYFMQTYSIVLGRNSKKSMVDVNLSLLGGGMNISRNHARIFYDFTRRRFALEVLGKNGCFVEGVHHSPGSPPVKLDSQDLLQIGDKEFYFLLPVKSILDGRMGSTLHGGDSQKNRNMALQRNLGMMVLCGGAGPGNRKNTRTRAEYCEEGSEEEGSGDGGDDDDESSGVKRMKRGDDNSGGVWGYGSGGMEGSSD